MKILGFIPARKGSKGIKNKYMVLLNNKPLIYYTLSIAKRIKSNVFPFVSTDSKKIKIYSEKIGLKNDYLRPRKLSGDSSSIVSAAKHALIWLQKYKKMDFDAILLLQPTTPIRNIKMLKKAIAKFKKENLQSLISVSQIKEHPYECVKYNNKNWNYLIKNPEKNKYGRQFYNKKYYFIDGSFYIAKISFLKKYNSFVNSKYTKLFIQRKNFSIDIDNKEDLLTASSFIRKN